MKEMKGELQKELGVHRLALKNVALTRYRELFCKTILAYLSVEVGWTPLLQ